MSDETDRLLQAVVDYRATHCGSCDFGLLTECTCPPEPRAGVVRLAEIIRAVARLHTRGVVSGNCTGCRQPWPCPTLETVRSSLAGTTPNNHTNPPAQPQLETHQEGSEMPGEARPVTRLTDSQQARCEALDKARDVLASKQVFDSGATEPEQLVYVASFVIGGPAELGRLRDAETPQDLKVTQQQLNETPGDPLAR